MRILVAVLGFVVCLGLAAGAIAQPAAVDPGDIANVLRTLQAPGATEAPVLFQSKEGFVRFLGAPPGGYFASRQSSGKSASAEGYARNFVEDHRGAFGIGDSKVTLSTRKVRSYEGNTYVRLSQQYGGLKVFGAEIVVQVDANGGVHNVVSELMRDSAGTAKDALPLTPGIDADEAVSQAKKLLAGVLDGVAASALSAAGQPELLLFNPALLELQGTTKLAWRVVLTAETGEPIKEDVFIDAQSGQLLFHYSLIKNGKAREIYDANGTWNMPSTPARDEGDPATGITDVDNAYDYMGDTYDFYYREHGRDSYDNEGATLIGLVRVPWQNASWNGVRMTFGIGYTVDDVTAHELTHAVTDNEIGLIYFGEPGALSEHFSDTWGEYVDLTNGKGNDSPEVRWLMGEDLEGGAGRSMKDPTIFGDPDRYYSPYFVDTTAAYDNGGVHINCGVGSKLVYLLTDGDTFNGQTVRGMGISRTADLVYATVLLLPPVANYEIYYLGLGAASTTLGYSMEDRLNIAKAGRAVEIEPAGLNIDGLHAFRATPTRNLDGDPVIALNWTPPPAEEYSRVVLVKSIGGYAQDITGGEQLLSAKTDRYLDENVQEGVEYFYTLFADLNSGLPQVLYARATAGGTPSEVFSEAFSDTIVAGQPSAAIDLAFSQLMFTPIGPPAGAISGDATTGYDGYEAVITPDVYELPVARDDAHGGAEGLALTDDGMVMYQFDGAAFPYFGKKYNTVYLASNGYIAFQAIDPTDTLNFPTLDAHMAIPRLSFLFADLAPHAGGEVWARELTDRVVLTFSHVPEYVYSSEVGLGVNNFSSNTVQIELFYSGHIRITYQELGVKNAVAGLSDGNGIPLDPADLFEDLVSVDVISNLSELPQEHYALSLEPVALQSIDAGELVSFTITAKLPAGTAQAPRLTGEWDGAGAIPFADNGNGTGTFYWQTSTADYGVYTARIRALLNGAAAYQDVRINVGRLAQLPVANNLRLSSGTPMENPAESRVVPLGRPLFAEYDYSHPQLAEDPSLYGEGDTILYWFRNHQLIAALTNIKTVPPSAMRANDVWYFRVIPVTLSYLSGEEAMSPVVTIGGMPQITSIAPAKGVMQGGETITIKGKWLSAALSVTFGGVEAAEVRAISSSEIEVVTPLHPIGTVDIVVTTAGGFGRLAYGFEFYDPAEGEQPDDKEGACLMCAGGSPVQPPFGGLAGDLIVAGMAFAALVFFAKRKAARSNSR